MEQAGDARRGARSAVGPGREKTAAGADRVHARRALGMDQGRFSTMRDVHRLESMSANPGSGTVLAAWERFVQGEDQVPGVRPLVAISWHRCREQYRVDPHLTEVPVAVAELDHTPEHDVVFAELGFRAASVAHEVGNFGGVVTVTDATGRILAEWGDQATLARASDANLAPWFCWS